MPTVTELYKEHEQLKRDGKNEEAIAKLNELLHVTQLITVFEVYENEQEAVASF